LIGTPLKGGCLAFKGRLRKIAGAGAARLAQAVAIEAGAGGCHRSRRRRKVEQSWRSSHDLGAAGASFAPRCACACCYGNRVRLLLWQPPAPALLRLRLIS